MVVLKLDPGLYLLNANPVAGTNYVAGEPALIVVGGNDATTYLSFHR
jgi:hypothetical protein